MTAASTGVERWVPTPDAIAHANVTALIRDLGLSDHTALLRFATEEPARFYERLVDRLGLHWDARWSSVVDLGRGKPFARWWPDAQLNAAANCLDRWIENGLGSVEALVWEGEDGAIRRYTFAELREAVARLGAVLRACGVGRGDTVGIFMPLIPETAIGLLAIAYIGAIAVPAFSGYGPDALAARLADARAKVLLTVDGVRRRGKPVVSKTIADEALRQAPSVTTVLVYSRAGMDVPMLEGRDRSWTDAVAATAPLATYERTSANDRVMLLYTSGSTGKPKGANH
ncbi:MAG: AMP-binding protein, partial [Candidatus Eremiobacteraeota bacterium]|nr:AMP-binding protein [Candidatus Eremiobacteraeota bacterium]